MTSVSEGEQRKKLDALARQIAVFERKGFDKKQYVSACDQFRETVIAVGNILKLDIDWQDLVKKLLSVLPNKNLSTDLRKSVAECIGTIGFAMCDRYGEYLDCIFSAFNKASQKYFEEKSLILHAICSSLELYGASPAKLLSDLKPVEEVMKSVKKILDANESHVVLNPLLNICLIVGKYFPTVFKENFLDVLDFTVGWYTELDQPPEVAEKCSEVLLGLRSYFHQAVPSSVELMTQFVEDAKVYIEELCKNDLQKDVKCEESLQKTALLLRSLATILNVFNSADVLPYLLPFAKKVFVELDHIMKVLSEVFLKEVCIVFSEMIKVYWSLLQISAQLSELVSSVQAMVVILNHPLSTVKTLTQLLDFYRKVFDNLPPNMTSQVLPLVFSHIMESKYKQSSLVGQFLSKLLMPRALPTLQVAYKCTREKLLRCFHILKSVEENDITMKAKNAEEEAVVLLQAFSTLAGAKNSLIGMMGLSPSLLKLLSDEAPLTEKWFIVRYPICHLALLHVLKLHCERHDNFISNSTWFNEKKHSLIIQEGLTSNYLTKIVTLLAQLLSLSVDMWSDTRDTVLEWIRGLAFGTSHEMLQQILNVPEMVVLRKALLQSFLNHFQDKKIPLESPKKSFNVTATRVRQYTLLRRLAVFDLVQDDIISDDFSFTYNVCKTVRSCSREMAISLWQTIPPPFFVKCGLSQSFKETIELSQEKVAGALFTSDHFKLMTDFLLNSIIPTYLLNDAYDDKWLEDVVTMIYSSSTSNYSLEIDHVAKWRWALGQTAQYCIDNRMRTPLGKPLETFLCLEKEMRRLAASTQSQRGNTPTDSFSKDAKGENEEGVLPKMIVVNRSRKIAGDDDEDGNENVEEQRHLTDAEQWWRVRAFLETIELLDKLISYAGDGTVFQLSNVSQSSRQFFITNAVSCSSWLFRMYLITMPVAYRNSNYAQVLRFGSCILRDFESRSTSPSFLEKNGKDNDIGSTESFGTVIKTLDATILTCLSWMVRALIELGGSQAILGLYAWTKKIYGVSHEWIICAADMARGRVEQALDGLVKCCSSQDLPENVGKTIRQLIITGLNMLRNPDEMVRVWKELNNKDTVQSAQSCAAPLGFEEIAWERMKNLVTFSPPADNNSNSHVVWDVDSRLQSTELKLMEIAQSFNRNGRIDLMRRLGEDAHILILMDTSTKLIVKASVLHVLASSLKEAHKTDSLLLCDTLDGIPFCSNYGSSSNSMIICQQLSQWIENCRSENGVGTSLKVVSDESLFHLNNCSLLRKLGNLRSANRQTQMYRIKMQSCSKMLSLQSVWPPGFEKENFSSVMNGIYNPFSNAIEDPNKSKLLSASTASKLLYAQGLAQANSRVCTSAFAMLYDALSDEVDRLLYKSNALFKGTPTVAPNALTVVLSQQLMLTAAEESNNGFHGSSHLVNSNKNCKRNAANLLSRSILKLAGWLENDTALINVALSRSTRISWHLFGVELSSLPPPLNPSSGLVGSLLSASCKLSFHLAKAHARFADWAYKLIHVGEDDNGGMIFTDDERSAITWQIMNTFPNLEKETVESMVQVIGKTEYLNLLKDTVCSTFEGLFCKKAASEKLFGANSVLYEKWAAARSRTVAYVISCVHSYFAFIGEHGKTSGQGNWNAQGSIGTVVACLRILQLFMKYSEALQTIVDEELLRTDDSLWKDILPQLFARLNHPSPAVRNSLCILLERIAESSPHALCYPAIIGAIKPYAVISEERMAEKIEELDEELVDAERKMKVEADRSLMYECCQRIVSRLSQIFPVLVENVSHFVQELQRINMLFDERWAFVLANLDHEMSRRIAQIESERARTLNSTHLNPKEQQAIIKEKTVILSEMVFRILEALYERTCLREPATANEKHFRDLYHAQISSAFQNYKVNKHEPKKAWQLFKQLLVTLTQRTNKRGAHALSTADMSPRLCNMKNTQIPLPGQELKDFAEVVTMTQITKQAIILPTKTRPKKICFIGSDGKEYPFLFKGQEDLHLDERIMQLLRICNLMLLEKEKDWPQYSASHYSVTPLGSRSGLIQWVDGATPLFHVYRKWQNRKSAYANSKRDSMEVDRPSELFFKKLRAAFNANSISADILSDRQKWPLPILENVVSDLMKETPRDLLSRELWIRAGSCDTWYKTTERFARSTAVMSMLGSILGLGDRHLDNVLVNLDSGQVIHIDYNVCFDKGRHLRVPETVPFRLTNNIVHALGPTQIEGTFRLSCEHMMMKLRAGSEVLLTILDTFVYDPLVDWAAAQEQFISSGTIGVATLLAVYGTEPYPGTALPLTYSLFSLRVKEFGIPWRANGDRLHYALLRMIEALEKSHRSREGILDYGSMVKGKIPGHEDLQIIRKERIEASNELKQAIAEHKQLMHDFRPLLRSLAYSDEKFRNYLKRYKESFMEPLLMGCKIYEIGNESDYNSVASLFEAVNEKLDSTYDKLVALDKKDDKASVTFIRPESKLLQEETDNLLCKKQEQNVYAKTVSMRIKQKLEGKDIFFGDSKMNDKITSSNGSLDKESLSVAEQVEVWIQQAISLSNLALMYEGWTAWV